MEPAFVVVQAEEQGADAFAVLGDAVPADHAVGRLPMLHLHPPTGSREVRLVVALRHDAVLTEPGLVGEPRSATPEILGPWREQEVRSGVEIVQVLGACAHMETLRERREPFAPLGERSFGPSFSPSSSSRSKRIRLAGISAASMRTRDSAGMQPELELVEREPSLGAP